MDNVIFKGTDAGIRIKSNRGRGNDIYNLHYSNIKMEDVKVPIEIVAYYPERTTPKTEKPDLLTEHTPFFSTITIKNVTATDTVTTPLHRRPARGSHQETSHAENDILHSQPTTKAATIQQADITEKNVTVTTATPTEKRDNVNITLLP